MRIPALCQNTSRSTARKYLANVAVPKGYRRVEDDRLNPKRAEQNLGWAVPRMLFDLGHTVPRRLIKNQNTGSGLFTAASCRWFLSLYIGWTAAPRVGAWTLPSAMAQLGQAHCTQQKRCPTKTQAGLFQPLCGPSRWQLHPRPRVRQDNSYVANRCLWRIVANAQRGRAT